MKMITYITYLLFVTSIGNNLRLCKIKLFWKQNKIKSIKDIESKKKK